VIDSDREELHFLGSGGLRLTAFGRGLDSS
jgi:hypothetical protein